MTKTTRHSKIAALALGAFLFAASLSAAEARDKPTKIIYDGKHWFCYTDPVGITLAEFRSICQEIEAGGKGEFVEYIVDKRGKMRRKAGSKPKPASHGLRGSVA